MARYAVEVMHDKAAELAKEVFEKVSAIQEQRTFLELSKQIAWTEVLGFEEWKFLQRWNCWHVFVQELKDVATSHGWDMCPDMSFDRGGVTLRAPMQVPELLWHEPFRFPLRMGDSQQVMVVLAQDPARREAELRRVYGGGLIFRPDEGIVGVNLLALRSHD